MFFHAMIMRSVNTVFIFFSLADVLSDTVAGWEADMHSTVTVCHVRRQFFKIKFWTVPLASLSGKEKKKKRHWISNDSVFISVHIWKGDVNEDTERTGDEYKAAHCESEFHYFFKAFTVIIFLKAFTVIRHYPVSLDCISKSFAYVWLIWLGNRITLIVQSILSLLYC